MERISQISKKNLHVRIDQDVYEKLRHISFYEQQSLSEVVNRLLIEYVEEKAIEEPEIVCPPIL
ncbi:MAG TPA: hypothetical protein PLZ08_07890 [Bacillota bacterium]|jgi:predicted CopG family antitoxin|nr:hypothetical protein [Bacillota bacterium]HOL10136.1 hypothetical protein [Bacillota bacterium]HPO97868.1 hypothetical protein [Bacillota bacterium]